MSATCEKGHSVYSLYSFCPECGSKVIVVKENPCPKCGIDNLPKHRFCVICGSKLAKEK